MPIKNPKPLFAQMIKELRSHSLDNINVSIDYDSGIILLVTRNYKLKIIIDEFEVGYDFDLSKDLSGKVYQGSGVNTDLLINDYDPEWTKEIFEEVRLFVKSLLSNKLYYGVFDGNAVFARPSKDGQYRVTFVPTKRRFFVSIKQETWPKSKVMNDPRLTRLDARS